MKTFQIILFLSLSTFAISQNYNPSTVDVTGEGIVKVVPDQVIISVQVENKGANPKELKRQNDRTINEVFQFIKSMKIKDSDVKTQYIRLNKNYDYQTKSYNYVANQSIAIRLKDLSKYETLINGLLESGINRIEGVNFLTSKKEELQSVARIKAMKHAKKKAEEYAGVLDQTIGKAVSISELTNSTYPGSVNRKASMVMSLDSSAMEQQTISLGEIEIRTIINVRFLLN